MNVTIKSILIFFAFMIFFFIGNFTVFASNQQNIGNSTTASSLAEEKLKSEIKNTNTTEEKLRTENEKLKVEQGKLEAEKDKLKAEEEKLKVEKNKLSNEYFWSNISPIMQALTVIISIITASMSIKNANKANENANKANENQIRNLKSQIEKNEREHISSLLKDLGSNSPIIKIAAIQGLSQYKTSISYLINVLKFGDDKEVLNSTFMALSTMPVESLNQLIKENRNLHKKQLVLIGELLILGMKKAEVAKLLNIKYEALIIWLENEVKMRHINELLDETIRYKELLSDADAVIVEVKKEHILSEWKSLSYMISNIIRAMAEVSKNLESLSITFDFSKTFLRAIVLDNIDISGWNFEDAYLCNASFDEAICNYTNFKGICAVDASFRGSKLNKSVFDKAILHNSDIGKTECKETSFKECKCRKTSFGGANLNNATFEGIHMEEGKFSGSFGEKISFADAEIYRSEFMNVKYENANFTNAKLNNSRFDKSDISESIFKGVNLNLIFRNDGKLETIS